MANLLEKDFDAELLSFLAGWKVFSDHGDVLTLEKTPVVALLVGNSENNARDIAPSLANAYRKLGPDKLAVIYLCEHAEDCDGQQEFESAMPPDWIKVRDLDGTLLECLCEALGQLVSETLFLVSGDTTKVISEDAGFVVYKNEEHGFPWTEEAIMAADQERRAALVALRARLLDCPGLKFLEDMPLIRRAEPELSADIILSQLQASDLVAVLFAARGSPPCRPVVSQLRATHAALLAAGHNAQVVLVSSDEDDSAFQEHLASMPAEWLAVRFAGGRDARRQLSELFGVCAVPTLVWVDPSTGKDMTAGRGLEAVALGAEFFPWSPEDFARGQQQQQQHRLGEEEEAGVAVAVGELQQLWAQRGQVQLRDFRHRAEMEEDHSVYFGDFATVAAAVRLRAGGRYYYEVEVLELRGCEGAQLGWCSPSFTSCAEYSEEGVGDDASSWGFDGVRVLRWGGGGGGSEAWGGPWRSGDVLGLAADLRQGGLLTLALSVNGSFAAPNGVAFLDEELGEGGEWVAPALSAQEGVFRVNFGQRPFRHAPPAADYMSVHTAAMGASTPAGHDRAA